MRSGAEPGSANTGVAAPGTSVYDVNWPSAFVLCVFATRQFRAEANETSDIASRSVVSG